MQCLKCKESSNLRIMNCQHCKFNTCRVKYEILNVMVKLFQNNSLLLERKLHYLRYLYFVDEDTNNLCIRCYRHEPPNSKVKSIKWVSKRFIYNN